MSLVIHLTRRLSNLHTSHFINYHLAASTNITTHNHRIHRFCSLNSSEQKQSIKETPRPPTKSTSSIGKEKILSASAAATASLPYSSKQIRQNVQGYVFTKYINYIKNYEQVLEKKFPTAMQMYRVFVDGMKDFYRDMKLFLKISRIANTSALGLRALTRKELELYYQMPKDMLRVAPVLLFSALPFANYFILPLAYMYPSYVFSSHFWSKEQKPKFYGQFLIKRLRYNLPVYRFIQKKLLSLPKDDANTELFKSILGRVGSGHHPTAAEILAVSALFTTAPLSLEALPLSHLKQLCGLHGIHKGLQKRTRLARHAFIIHHMDLAIRREGGVHNMPPESLQKACYIRGLNAKEMTNEAMVEWLTQWVEVSLPVDGTNISMLLHLPILISYNHPNNWKLLHEK